MKYHEIKNISLIQNKGYRFIRQMPIIQFNIVIVTSHFNVLLAHERYLRNETKIS